MFFPVPSKIHWRPVTRVAGLGLAVMLSCAPLMADLATGMTKKEKERDRREKEEKKRGDTAYLPEARPVAMRFVAGQSIEIELEAAAGTVRQMEFLVRQAPQHGMLSAIRPHVSDPSRAVVTYTHSSPQAALADSFTFACRVPEGSWSAPATVVLVGQRMEPKVEVIENPSFGRIFIGEQRSGRVTVRNVGSSPLQKELTWQEPWSGPSSLSVPVGATQEFLVTFRPTKAGEYRQDMMIQPGVSSSRVILYADCVLPFSVSPSRLQLEFKESTGERSAIVSLVNSRGGAVKADVVLPPGLQGPAQVEIAPSSKTDVRLWLPKSHVERFSGKVAIKSGDSSATLEIEARPAPAAMKLVSPEHGGIDFGKVTTRSQPSHEVVLENLGGESLVVEAKALTPFAIEGAGGAVTIEPRQRRAFKVSLHSERPGSQNGQLEFLSGTGRITVPLQAEVEESKAPMSAAASPELATVPGTPSKTPPALSEVQPARVSSGSTGPTRTASAPRPKQASQSASARGESGFLRRTPTQTAMLALLTSKGMPMPSDAINPYLDQVEGVEVLDRNSSSITVAWKKPSVMPSGWVAEMSSMVYHQELNAFVKIWNRYPNWKPVEVDGERIGIQLFGLRPAEQFEFRFMGLDREGKVSQPSDVLLTSTPDSWRVPAWAWRLMIVIALALAGYVLFRVRRGDFLVEA